MSLTGGVKEGEAWNETFRKGLLSKTEATMLQDYPGGRILLILCSWSMQAVKEALTKDCFWQPRGMHCAHIHNRLNVHICDVIRAAHQITYLMALPIPFPYFHVMNFIMVMNFLILAFAFATFKTFTAVVPFGFATLIYMGLREVSTALADPFGVDQVDFPIADFMDYAFDHSISILEAFSDPRAYERVTSQLKATKGFNDEQLLRPANANVMYSTNRNARENHFSWNRSAPLRQQDEGVLPTQLLRGVLLGPGAGVGKDSDEQAGRQATEAEQADDDPEANSHSSIEHERGLLESMKAEIKYKKEKIERLQEKLGLSKGQQALPIEEVAEGPSALEDTQASAAQLPDPQQRARASSGESAYSDDELVGPAVQHARERLRTSETFDEKRLRIRQILEQASTSSRRQAGTSAAGSVASNDGGASEAGSSAAGSRSGVHRRRAVGTDRS